MRNDIGKKGVGFWSRGAIISWVVREGLSERKHLSKDEGSEGENRAEICGNSLAEKGQRRCKGPAVQAGLCEDEPGGQGGWSGGTGVVLREAREHRLTLEGHWENFGS